MRAGYFSAEPPLTLSRLCIPSSCLMDSMPDFFFTHDIASNLKGEPQYMLLEQLVPRRVFSQEFCAPRCCFF
jgi:hypothetical protein